MKYFISLLTLLMSFSSHASTQNCEDMFFEEMPYAYMDYDKNESVGTITLRDIPTAEKSEDKKLTRMATPVYMRLSHISQSFESSKVMISSANEKDSNLRSFVLNGPRNEVLNLFITIQMSEGVSTKQLKANIQKFMEAYPLMRSPNEVELLAAVQILNGI